MSSATAASRIVGLFHEIDEGTTTMAEGPRMTAAQLGERTPARLTHRNGYRARAWDTQVGELELHIPRLRSDSYFPSFLEPRRRGEQALVAVVQEAYVNGISTRKVDRLVNNSACAA